MDDKIIDVVKARELVKDLSIKLAYAEQAVYDAENKLQKLKEQRYSIDMECYKARKRLVELNPTDET